MLRLARVFGSPQAALEASARDLVSRGRLTREQANQVEEISKSLDLIEARIAEWQLQGMQLIAIGDEAYPVGLMDLRNPPPLLYLRGMLSPQDSKAVAIIGTREPNRAGIRLARALARGLVSRGFCIVSGLARGIDTAGHRGALAVKGGRTFAILGCGLLRVYPPENAMLAANIANRGAVISEVPPDMEVDRKLLLARDRIQAALSQAVIVIQAHGECGSLVTARYAVRCHRLLYGVPWSEGPFAEGWQALKNLHARPIRSEKDLKTITEEIDTAQDVASQKELL